MMILKLHIRWCVIELIDQTQVKSNVFRGSFRNELFLHWVPFINNIENKFLFQATALFCLYLKVKYILVWNDWEKFFNFDLKFLYTWYMMKRIVQNVHCVKNFSFLNELRIKLRIIKTYTVSNWQTDEWCRKFFFLSDSTFGFVLWHIIRIV